MTPRPTRRPSAEKILATEGGLLYRGDLRALGLERRAVDAVFNTLPNILLPGYSRPLIKADDYRAYIAAATTTKEIA